MIKNSFAESLMNIFIIPQTLVNNKQNSYLTTHMKMKAFTKMSLKNSKKKLNKNVMFEFFHFPIHFEIFRSFQKKKKWQLLSFMTEY